MDFDVEFARNTSLIKQIGKIQLSIDPTFKGELHELQAKFYSKKIDSQKFWEEYKKSLLKSVGKDKQVLTALIKKTDSKLKQQFKEAEKQEKSEPHKTPIDLSLPK